MKKIFVLIFSFLLCSCVSMSSGEKRAYREIKSYGLTKDAEKEKSALAGGLLSLLPGGGNFYLEQYGAGTLNFLTYPISVVWALPQTLIDISTINKQSIVDFYRYDKDGQILLEAAREGRYKRGVNEYDILSEARKKEKSKDNEKKETSDDKIVINNNFNSYPQQTKND